FRHTICKGCRRVDTVGMTSGAHGVTYTAEAVRQAALDVDPVTKKRKLRLIAEKAVALAVKGEAWAVQHIADRLDGRAATEAGGKDLLPGNDRLPWICWRFYWWAHTM